MADYLLEENAVPYLEAMGWSKIEISDENGETIVTGLHTMSKEERVTVPAGFVQSLRSLEFFDAEHTIPMLVCLVMFGDGTLDTAQRLPWSVNADFDWLGTNGKPITKEVVAYAPIEVLRVPLRPNSL